MSVKRFVARMVQHVQPYQPAIQITIVFRLSHRYNRNAMSRFDAILANPQPTENTSSSHALRIILILNLAL